MTENPNIIRLPQNPVPVEQQEVIEAVIPEAIEVKQIGFAGRVLTTIKGIPGVRAIMDVLVLDNRHPADIQQELIDQRQAYSQRLLKNVANDNPDSGNNQIAA